VKRWNIFALRNHIPMLKQLSFVLALFLGCLFLSFTDPYCACSVYVPNVFSPDGNGSPDNETFRPFLPSDCNFTDYTFRIFDRWGKLVYESENPEESWDGTFNGQPLAANVYVYILKVDFAEEQEGKSEMITGDVALIRK